MRLPDIVNKFPNVKACNQDKAHASRRFTKRLWACDDRVHTVYKRFIGSKWSICRLLQHRAILAKKFSDIVLDLDSDSTSKPLANAVITFPAITRTAQFIHKARNGKESVKAGQWMQFLDEKSCVLFGFIAEAGQAAVKVTRSMTFESEAKFQLADHREVANNFLCEATTLFSRGKAQHCGYGKGMMKHLQTQIVMVPFGQVKTLGGPDSVTDKKISMGA